MIIRQKLNALSALSLLSLPLVFVSLSLNPRWPMVEIILTDRKDSQGSFPLAGALRTGLWFARLAHMLTALCLLSDLSPLFIAAFLLPSPPFLSFPFPSLLLY